MSALQLAREALEGALEALKEFHRTSKYLEEVKPLADICGAIKSIDAAIAQEPVAWAYCREDGSINYDAEWVISPTDGDTEGDGDYWMPLFAIPKPAPVLPASYKSGYFLTNQNGGSLARLNFTDVISAQEWFERLTAPKDAS